MEFVYDEGEEPDYRGCHFLEMSESVWQNDWKKSTTTIFYEMEKPPKGFETRLLGCERYLLVIADDASSDAFNHRFQRMVLYDRKTCEEAYDIPQFLTQDFASDTALMWRNLHLICNLKWDAIP